MTLENPRHMRPQRLSGLISTIKSSARMCVGSRSAPRRKVAIQREPPQRRVVIHRDCTNPFVTCGHYVGIVLLVAIMLRSH